MKDFIKKMNEVKYIIIMSDLYEITNRNYIDYLSHSLEFGEVDINKYGKLLSKEVEVFVDEDEINIKKKLDSILKEFE